MALATRDIKVGYEVTPITLTISRQKIKLFSTRTTPRGDPLGEKWAPNIHISEEMAKSIGFPDTVPEALQMFAYMSKFMASFFGEGWVRGGKLSTNFIRLIMPGDTITIKGVVKERTPEDSAIRITLEVWCENQRGEKAIVGVASGLVR